MDVEVTKKNAHELFNKICKTYDILNTVLSFGLHHHWRKSPLKWLEKDKQMVYLDLASGTGDQLFSILDNMPNVQKAYAVDPADKMLEIAEKKLTKKPYQKKVDFLVACADRLPFEDNFFDLSTITFGLRNLPDTRKGITELYRVTKNSGQVHIIEFGKPTGIIKPFYKIYMNFVLPLIGKIFSKHRFAYNYLNNSIEHFEDNSQTTRILFEAGFQSVFRESIFFGIVNHFIAIR
jgi:demethylmenaquinone methyltransferase/2-methoxy-6-polyprenyl-1,4-benzoquinol methylase